MRRVWCRLFHGQWREPYIYRGKGVWAYERERWRTQMHCFKCKHPPFNPAYQYKSVAELESAERQRRLHAVGE